jgi:hypothetical protein
MRIEIRNDSVMLDGYVNAVERDSRPVITPAGKCIERIEARAFQRALERAANIDLLLNHDKDRKLGSTDDGNLELFEDNIGLRAICTVTDAEVIEKAAAGLLRGWSFGMFANKERVEERAGALPRRIVEDLDLFEVSIVDNRKMPCYAGTSIEQRGGDEIISEQRITEFRAVTVDNTVKESPDLSAFEDKIKMIKEKRKT